MIWIIIGLVLVIAVLVYALFYQIKGNKDQAGEQETLLRDYQRRVDEQQQLLEDYRSLQKNFENVGQGYEQALDLYDKMEENSRKLEERNAFLEKQNADMQKESASNSEAMRTSKEALQQIVQKMTKELEKMDAAAAAPLSGLVYSIRTSMIWGVRLPLSVTTMSLPRKWQNWLSLSRLSTSASISLSS